MKYYILGLLFFLWLPQPAFATATATATATLDRSITALGESVQLTIQVDGSADQEPDLSVLHAAFEVLSQSQSSSYSFSHGSFKRNAQWSISLMPKHEGTLLIPVISLGNMETAPLHLRVLSRASASVETKEDIFLRVSVSAEQVYVQAQVILTVKLFRAVHLLQAQLSEPDMSHVIMKKLGEDKSYETVIDQRRFVVTERKYALFPQQSGVLQVPPLQFNGRVSLGGGYGTLNQVGRTVRVQSAMLDIKVLPMPDAWENGKLWLPADQITVRELFHEVADNGILKVGDPLTRTIEVRAEGLTAEQLPLLVSSSVIGELKQYPDQPVLSTEVGPLGVVGMRREKVVLIPTMEGRFMLPAISMSWWNVKTQRMQSADIPARYIVVESKVPATGLKPEGEASAVLQDDATQQSFMLSKHEEPFLWQWLSIIFAVGWLMTVILWRYRVLELKRVVRRRKEKSKKTMRTLKKQRQVLELACQQHDLDAAVALLPAWGATVLKKSNITHYSQLRGHDVALDDALLHMERSLYGKGVQQAWSGDVLLAALPLLTETVSDEQVLAVLKPLYHG